MKTYVLEVGGKPAIAFRAETDEEAALYTDGRTFLPGYRPEGELTVRPATIPEQARWRRASADDDGETEGDDEAEGDVREHDPDGLLVSLSDEEE